MAPVSQTLETDLAAIDGTQSKADTAVENQWHSALTTHDNARLEAVAEATVVYSQALADAEAAYRTALFDGVDYNQAYADRVAARATALEALEQAKAEAAEAWTVATAQANVTETNGYVSNETTATIAYAGKQSQSQLDRSAHDLTYWAASAAIDNVYSSTTTTAQANNEYAAAINQAAYLQGHYAAIVAALNHAVALPGAIVSPQVLTYAQQQAGAMAAWWNSVTPDFLAKANGERSALNQLQTELNSASAVQSAADRAAYQVNVNTVRQAEQTRAVNDATTYQAYINGLTAAGGAFVQAVAASRQTQAFELAASGIYLAIGERDGNPYTWRENSVDIGLANQVYDHGLLQASLGYAPQYVSAQVTANNASANDRLTWVNATTQADTTQGIANANAQLAFDLASSAANDIYRVTLANLQQAFENGSAAQFASTLANLFAPGVSAMGGFAVALAAAAQTKQAAVQQGLRDYKVAASQAEKNANDAINTAGRDKTVTDLDNEQAVQITRAELNRDAAFARGQSATDAASTGHLQTAVPIAPTPGALSISHLTERVIVNYWATVPYVQASLVTDMYNRGPQQYYSVNDLGGNVLWASEWPAWRNTGEQLRAGLVLERRPYDALNSQLNDYNPYRTSAEFKPREDWTAIIGRVALTINAGMHCLYRA